MAYRCKAATPESVVQLIAASYLRHGYYWYVTGTIPDGKDPSTSTASSSPNTASTSASGRGLVGKKTGLPMPSTFALSGGSSSW